MSEESTSGESCGTCGGDRRIANSFGQTATCPSCHGSGRRTAHEGFHDVTKTKASHHRGPSNAAAAAKPTWPTTIEGIRLATAVRDAKSCPQANKDRLIREIMDHEDTHGQCTKTFAKKIRKEIGPAT
ncbi:molecular chaperone DnaJ [bacterium]|nr:MAG: molecular chaperone DnaJ [bacterium]